MFENLLGGLVDKEKITYDTIQSTLEDVAEELNCSFKDFFIMIKPTNDDFDMRFDIFKYDENYFRDDSKPAISLTLPKTQKEYDSEFLFPFFFNAGLFPFLLSLFLLYLSVGD